MASSENSSGRIERIRGKIERQHLCVAIHIARIPFGDSHCPTVEAFALIDHPEATHAYGWGEDDGHKETLFVILAVPPIKSAKDAVRAVILNTRGSKPTA